MRELSGDELDALMSGHGGRPPAEIEQDLAIPSLTRLRLMSAGPSASVFRAYQTATQRTVAVKVLHDELSSDVGQRFDRERAITGQLSGHTGVVPLLHTGTTADGEPYLVLPYYRRGSLADLMARYGPLPWREATFLMKPVASTVAEIHLWGLVHRNLKPSNILLTDFLRPRVADLGMCLQLEHSSTAATLVSGPYAPEESGVIGPANPTMDVFGLAATLWSLLAGGPLPAADAERRRLDPGEMAIATSRLARSRPPKVPGGDTPPRIAELIERSMSPDIADRPQTVATFLAELGHDDFRSTRTVTSGSTARTETSRRATPVGGDDRAARDADDAASGELPVERDTTTEERPTEPASAAAASEGPQPTESMPTGSTRPTGANAPASTPTRSASSTMVMTGSELVEASSSATLAAESEAGATATSTSVQAGPIRTPDRVAGHLYYLLALVALITTGIIVMVAAAILAY